MFAFETVLVVIFFVILLTHPIYKHSYSDPHNVNVVAAATVIIGTIYWIYSFVKSKLNK